MQLNFLIIKSLQQFYSYYGDEFKVECPTGSGNYLDLKEVSEELARRLQLLFLKNEKGRRAIFGNNEKQQQDPLFKNYLLFYEYFNGDSGEGLGAAHHTGWTALIANLIQEDKIPN